MVSGFSFHSLHCVRAHCPIPSSTAGRAARPVTAAPALKCPLNARCMRLRCVRAMSNTAQAASAAASTAVAAMREPWRQQRAAQGIQSLLMSAVHCSISLQIPTGTTVLSSGNLLGRPQLSLLASPTLAGLCIGEQKSKLLRLAGQASLSRHSLEDVRSIADGSGCITIVCLPLLRPAELPPSSSSAAGSGSCGACAGALTVAFRRDADISSQALKGAVLLAHALAMEQWQALADLCSTVSALVLPPPRPAASAGGGPAGAGGGERESDSDYDFGVSDLDMANTDWDQSDSEDEADDGGGQQGGGMLRRRGGAPAAAAAGPQAGRARSASLPPQQSQQLAGVGGDGSGHARLRVLLGFESATMEQQFAAYQAAHMQHIDPYAYLSCFCFFCLEAFLPGTPFQLAKRMGWRCLPGLVSLLPGLLLAFKRTRPWFTAHRTAMLLFTWLSVLSWQTGMGNYMHLLDKATFRHPFYLQSFGWLFFSGMAFQMPFRCQLVVLPLSFAINAQLLPAICAKFYDELAPTRCLVTGLLKAFLHGVLLPLACCYVCEAHTRGLFLQAQAGLGSSSQRLWFGAGRLHSRA